MLARRWRDRICRGALAHINGLIGVRPELQLRRQTNRIGGRRRDSECGIEAGRTAASVQVDPDPGGAGEGLERYPRVLPEPGGLRFLSRRRVRHQPASLRHRAKRRHHRCGSFFRDLDPGSAPVRPECLPPRRIRHSTQDVRRRSHGDHLGPYVHAARERPELSGYLRRRGSVSRRAGVCGFRCGV